MFLQTKKGDFEFFFSPYHAKITVTRQLRCQCSFSYGGCKMIMKKRLLPIFMVIFVAFVMMPAASEIVHAEDNQETALSGDVLNGCKARIRPARGH